MSAPEDVAGHLAASVTARRLPAPAITVRRTLAQDLDGSERRVYAWTWPCPPEQLRAACAEIRASEVAQAWPLDREVALERIIQWWAFGPAR